MVQRTFYALEDEAPPEAPGWEPAPDDIHTLRHGYNLADLERFTRMAISRVRGVFALDPDERYEVAWSAIVERLYTAPDEHPPTPWDLVFAGQDTLSRHVEVDMREHGLDKTNGGVRRRYAAYWLGPRTFRMEPKVVDGIALWQIWPTLTDKQRQALLALAATGDHVKAAALAGMTMANFRSQLSFARQRFLSWWHEGETPSRVWRPGRRSGARSGLDHKGKQRITVSQLEEIRDRYHQGEKLTDIGADYEVAQSTLSRLLSGDSQAAPDPDSPAEEDPETVMAELLNATRSVPDQLNPRSRTGQRGRGDAA